MSDSILLAQIERAVESLISQGLVVRTEDGRLYAKEFAPVRATDGECALLCHLYPGFVGWKRQSYKAECGCDVTRFVGIDPNGREDDLVRRGRERWNNWTDACLLTNQRVVLLRRSFLIGALRAPISCTDTLVQSRRHIALL